MTAHSSSCTNSTSIDTVLPNPSRFEDFHPNPADHLPPHLHIYTWRTASIRELTHLLASALPHMLPSPAAGTRIAFRLIFPDTRPSSSRPTGPGPGGIGPRFLGKDLGSVVVADDMVSGADVNGMAQSAEADALQKLDGDAERTLADSKFLVGDYLSCAIIPPLRNGEVAPPPLPMSSIAPSARNGIGPGPLPRRGGSGYGRGMRDHPYGRGGRGGFRGGAGPSTGGGLYPGVPSGRWDRNNDLGGQGYGRRGRRW